MLERNIASKNSPPEPKITTDSGQHLQICNVKPTPGPKGTANAAGIPDKIRSFYLANDVCTFVMSGIPKYTEAFFNEEFLKQEEGNNFALKLVGLLQDQVKYLEEGLEIHGKLVPPGVQPMSHTQMKSSVQETEIYVYSTLASLNNATLRRSESGRNVIVRDSFR
jgi:hypothetical protein